MGETIEKVNINIDSTTPTHQYTLKKLYANFQAWIGG